MVPARQGTGTNNVEATQAKGIPIEDPSSYEHCFEFLRWFVYEALLESKLKYKLCYGV